LEKVKEKTMARPNFTEKDAKTIVNLYESGLSGHPAVARLLKTAFATGNFSELDHYLSKNQGLVEKMATTNLLTSQLAGQNPFYPFPAGEELEKLQGPIRLGIVNMINGVPIYFGIPPEITTMHGMIAGRTGTGKTWFNANFLEQLIKHGKTHGSL